MVKIIPAILTKELGDFKAKLELINGMARVSEVHVDFADGQFVPSSTLMPVDIPSLPDNKCSFSAHLMILEPSRYLEDLKKAGFKMIAVHYEAFKDMEGLAASVDGILEAGLEPQIVVNPETPINKISTFFSEVDNVLVMGVNPGFYGSPYLPETEDKVKDLRSRGFYGTITVDGGVTKDKIRPLIKAGVDSLVAGSAIFRSNDPKAAYLELLEEATKS